MDRDINGILKDAVAGIAGIGGLGSNAAVALARMGIGRLVLADYDIVDESNLNRQHYMIRHLGMKKVHAIKQIIGEINPQVHIESHDIYVDGCNAPEIFKDADIVIEAFDVASCKAEFVNSILGNTGKKVIAASGLAGYGPANSIVTRRVTERLYIVGDGVSGLSEGEKLLASRVAIAANHQANLAVRLLIGEEI
ncbi:dinucleotide-utilizing enzyme involved in molybdopterin/thiamine biosynthesis [Peptoclostridium acidaminophilum DSM 3953]|uniref:Dinucleotide-utilizing enzyme involved in molybdopterin/thiamine biosynthesis n=1 Tax=Peptoclostridium acidaminophilum DSM 3953 TaxID=1286171 RepID=W8U312_PEPAC|nr:sulfur carrier protein ThiS adenylyltransferase ThiF [Peptoclostridium acidaminophilum]AHM55396.1 dinucleotide-utilizing enzyme involved in molybdopterin/thiamine biosynthesis [Peptoclostridium acidaminophilum DSM 3953]